MPRWRAGARRELLQAVPQGLVREGAQYGQLGCEGGRTALGGLPSQIEVSSGEGDATPLLGSPWLTCQDLVKPLGEPGGG